MNQGLYSQGDINQLTSSARQNMASQVSGARQQAADRSAGMGYLMPYMSGGGGFVPHRTGAVQGQVAQARFAPTMANKQSQMQAGASAGNLASLLSQIEMTPERPTETPWFASEETYNKFMADLKAALAGLNDPLPDIDLPNWDPQGGGGAAIAPYLSLISQLTRGGGGPLVNPRTALMG
jgi:hypothetical protein